MLKDMTVGSPGRHIISFALPLLAGNIFQQAYNIADAAIVGRALGAEALAAVGASTSVQFLVMGFCIGIAVGFAIPVAQRFGAKDYSQMRRSIYNSMVLTAFFAVIITAVCLVLCHYILKILSTPDNIYDRAYSYLFVIFAGIPLSLLYNLLSAILRAVGDSRTPFIFLVISTILNIVLDILFIMVFSLDCFGAAVATVIAQGVSGVLCLILIFVKFDILVPKKAERRVTPKEVVMLLMMGVPMGLQYSITAIGSMVLQSANNALGSVYISAFTAASRIKQCAMTPFDAVATAVANFASQNLGAKKLDRIHKGIREGVAIGVGYGAAIGIVLVLFGRTLSGIFVDSGETAILDAAGQYLGTIGCFYWVLGILNTVRLTVQGLGYSIRAIYSGVVEMIARVVVSFAFVPIFRFGAICAADPSAWVSGAIYISITLFIILRSLRKKLGDDNKEGKAEIG